MKVGKKNRGLKKKVIQTSTRVHRNIVKGVFGSVKCVKNQRAVILSEKGFSSKPGGIIKMGSEEEKNYQFRIKMVTAALLEVNGRN